MLFPFIQIESVWILHRIGMFIPFPKSVLFWGNGGLLPGVHATWDQGQWSLGAMQTFCLKVSLGYFRIVRAMGSP